MKSTVENLSPTRVRVSVELTFEDLQPSLDSALTRIAKQVNIPGFRKGKVPARVIEQRVGREAVLAEAVNDAIPSAYQDALIEHGIVPVGRPEVDVTDIADGQQVAFVAEVDRRPEFTLPDLSGLRVEVDPAEATDADVDAQVDALRSRFATLSEVDRAAADGDVLLVNLSGATADGDVVEDLAGQALSYEVGSEGLLPGTDEAVRGAKAGDERSFTFTPLGGQWEGQDLVVTVEVSTVRERVLPALDDEFVQLASEFDTLPELRADLRERLSRVRKLEQGAQARAKVHQALLDAVDMPLPEGFVSEQMEEHFQQEHGGDHADTPEHRAEVEEQIRMSLKSDFIFDAIAQAQEIAVSEEELSAWLIQQAPRYGMTPDAFAKALVDSGQVSGALQDIRRAKALAWAAEQATVTDTAGAQVTLVAPEAGTAGSR
ncbi:MAG: trigger factor [Actinomycetales bacterium]|nr:trigger factor [Actinomycetales bacterium]